MYFVIVFYPGGEFDVIEFSTLAVAKNFAASKSLPTVITKEVK